MSQQHVTCIFKLCPALMDEFKFRPGVCENILIYTMTIVFNVPVKHIEFIKPESQFSIMAPK